MRVLTIYQCTGIDVLNVDRYRGFGGNSGSSNTLGSKTVIAASASGNSLGGGGYLPANTSGEFGCQQVPLIYRYINYVYVLYFMFSLFIAECQQPVKEPIWNAAATTAAAAATMGRQEIRE